MPKPRDRITVECSNPACREQIWKWPSQVRNNVTGRFFCSEACRRKIGSKPRRRPDSVCETCGVAFQPSNYSRPGRYCSTTCFNVWQKRNQIATICETCGQEFMMRPSDAERNARFCSRKCVGEAQVVNGLGRFHNGREVITDGSGYARIYEPDHPHAHSHGGRMMEHRWVAEQELGRPLTRDEQVHHVNGLKTDNRPENLVVLSPTEHTATTLNESGLRRRAAQLRIRELETQLARAKAKLARYRKRFGPL